MQLTAEDKQAFGQSLLFFQEKDEGHIVPSHGQIKVLLTRHQAGRKPIPA